MSDIAHAREGRHATERREIFIDYATMAIVPMSVAFSPALVWILVWMAAP